MMASKSNCCLVSSAQYLHWSALAPTAVPVRSANGPCKRALQCADLPDMIVSCVACPAFSALTCCAC